MRKSYNFLFMTRCQSLKLSDFEVFSDLQCLYWGCPACLIFTYNYFTLRFFFLIKSAQLRKQGKLTLHIFRITILFCRFLNLIFGDQRVKVIYYANDLTVYLSYQFLLSNLEEFNHSHNIKSIILSVNILLNCPINTQKCKLPSWKLQKQKVE